MTKIVPKIVADERKFYLFICYLLTYLSVKHESNVRYIKAISSTRLQNTYSCLMKT